MSKKTSIKKSGKGARRSGSGINRNLSTERIIIGGSILASVVIVVVVLAISASNQPNVTSGLPTPIGFPESAQDVGTMVGQVAPDFTLPDETGQLVTVSFDQTERPTVLFFNMGFG